MRNITEHARLFVRAIAEEAVEGRDATAELLKKRLGASSSAVLGGWAASIGFAVKRLQLPKPYERDYEYLDDEWQPVYRMDREVAEVILRLVDEDAEVHPL